MGRAYDRGSEEGRTVSQHMDGRICSCPCHRRWWRGRCFALWHRVAWACAITRSIATVRTAFRPIICVAASGALVAALQVGWVVLTLVHHCTAALLVLRAHSAGAALLTRLRTCAQIRVIRSAAALRCLRAAEISRACTPSSAAALPLCAGNPVPVQTRAAAVCEIRVNAVLLTDHVATARRRCDVAEKGTNPSAPSTLIPGSWLAA